MLQDIIFMDVNVFFLHQISRRNSQLIRILLTQWLKSSLPAGYNKLEFPPDHWRTVKE